MVRSIPSVSMPFSCVLHCPGDYVSMHCASSDCNTFLATGIVTGIAHSWLASFFPVLRRHVASDRFSYSRLSRTPDSCGKRSRCRIVSNTEAAKMQRGNAPRCVSMNACLQMCMSVAITASCVASAYDCSGGCFHWRSGVGLTCET